MRTESPAALRRKIERLEAHVGALQAELVKAHQVNRELLYEKVEAEMRAKQAARILMGAE